MNMTIRRLPPVLTATVIATVYAIFSSLYVLAMKFSFVVMFGENRELSDNSSQLKLVVLTTIMPWVFLWLASIIGVLLFNYGARKGWLRFKIEMEPTEPGQPG